MLELVERYGPGLLWAYALGLAIYSGVTLPKSTGFTAVSPGTFEKSWPVLFLFLGAGAWMAAYHLKRSGTQNWLTRAVDGAIGEGRVRRFSERLRFGVLGSLFFMLSGGVGVAACILRKAPEANTFFAALAFSAGLGMAISLVFHALRQRRRSE